VYSLREEIDQGKWVVRGRLNIPWTTPKLHRRTRPRGHRLPSATAQVPPPPLLLRLRALHGVIVRLHAD
jgi:hypothetical protein